MEKQVSFSQLIAVVKKSVSLHPFHPPSSAWSTVQVRKPKSHFLCSLSGMVAIMWVVRSLFET